MARFDEEHGKIVDAHWCTNEASGVALTGRRRPLILPDLVRLNWATDWSTKEQPKLMSLLYRCESLAVRVQEVLRDTSQRLAMQSLFTVIRFVLGFGETERRRAPARRPGAAAAARPAAAGRGGRPGGGAAGLVTCRR